MSFFLRTKKGVALGIIITVLVVSPFLATNTYAASPSAAGNTSEAAPISTAGITYLAGPGMVPGCAPLTITGGIPCDPGVRYNTYQIMLATIGVGPGIAQRQTYWNSIFYFAMRILLRELTQQIVTWINTGFQGNPAFIQDPAKFLAHDADQTIGNFIQSSDLNFLCEPFKLNIKLALGFQYSTSTPAYGCSLSQDILKNSHQAYDDFINGDFINGGGWDSWLSITTVPQNNQMGAMLIAQSQLDANLQTQHDIRGGELTQNNGILSMKECTRTEKDDKGNVRNVQKYKGDPGFNVISAPVGTVTSTSSKQITYREDSTFYTGSIDESCEIVTPGTMIADQLHNATNWDTDALNMANDINEIVGALGNFVITKAINEGFALINPNTLSPNDPAWKQGIADMQNQTGYDISNANSNNPNYQPDPSAYVSNGPNANAGVTYNGNNPDTNGTTNSLADGKANLQSYITAYEIPEQNYFTAYNSIYSAASTTITDFQNVIACYNSKGIMANSNIDTASTTIGQISSIKSSIVSNLVASGNNLNALNNISTHVNNAVTIADLTSAGNDFSATLPTLHTATDATNAQNNASSTISTSTASYLNLQVQTATSLQAQCNSL